MNIEEENTVGAAGSGQGCYVPKNLWSLVDVAKIVVLYDFKIFKINFITDFFIGNCKIRMFTGILNKYKSRYC